MSRLYSYWDFNDFTQVYKVDLYEVIQYFVYPGLDIKDDTYTDKKTDDQLTREENSR